MINSRRKILGQMDAYGQDKNRCNSIWTYIGHSNFQYFERVLSERSYQRNILQRCCKIKCTRSDTKAGVPVLETEWIASKARCNLRPSGGWG